MGVIEESLDKRRKIDALCLSAGEWDRLSTFANLLAVSGWNLFYVYAYHNIRLQRLLSSPSHPTKVLPSTIPFRPSRECIQNGKSYVKHQMLNPFKRQ